MGRIFGILLIVIGIWVGLEIYTYGVDGAFGGRLSAFSGGTNSAQSSRRESVVQRAGNSVQRSMDTAAERYRSHLDD